MDAPAKFVPDLETRGGLAAQLAARGVSKERVLAFFAAAKPTRVYRHRVEDRVSGQPASIDLIRYEEAGLGWEEELAYYVARYDIRVPDALLEHMISRDFIPERT